MTEEHGSDRFALKLPKEPEGPKGPKGLEGEGLAPSAPASSIDADLDDLADVQLWDSNSMCQAVPSLQQRNSFNSFNSYKQPLCQHSFGFVSCEPEPDRATPPDSITALATFLKIRWDCEHCLPPLPVRGADTKVSKVLDPVLGENCSCSNCQVSVR